MKAEFEDEDSGYVFEVETVTHDGAEMEVVIAASTGEIIKIEIAD
ncbi:MAG: PepSY domain-containing protein [Alphaproteobacteria bacterium]|nr:PepSY domain-containing protein [Alphaproteobacteria bacterium]